jgi:RNA polymerase-binding transcription factor DksA
MATIKNLVTFAAKFLKMGKDKKKVNPKAVKAKPAAKKVSKPTKKVAPKPKKAVKAKPVAKKKSVVKHKVAVVKKAAKPVKSKAKPVTKKPSKAVKPAKKVLVKKPAKPIKVAKAQSNVIKQTVQPAPKQLYKEVKPQKAAPKKGKMQTDLNLRYSDKELKEFKDLIDGKLNIARDELKNLKEALDNHTESQAGNKAWNMEEGTDTTEMEYLMNQISRQHQYIRNLELAMVRIENKTYGICRATGKLIPKERLRIVPHATLSLEAKMTRKTDEEVPATSNAAPPTDFAEGFED